MFKVMQEQLQQQADKLDAIEKREAPERILIEKKEKKLQRPKYDASTYLPYARLNGMCVLELRMERFFRIPSEEDVSDELGERLDLYDALKAQLNLALNTGEQESDGIWTDVLQKTVDILRGKLARAKGVSTREVKNLVYAQVNSDDVLGVAIRKVATRNATAAKSQGNPRNAANPCKSKP
eukprot:gene10911-462_t